MNKIQKFVLIFDKKVDLVDKNDNQHQKKLYKLIKVVAYDFTKLKELFRKKDLVQIDSLKFQKM